MLTIDFDRLGLEPGMLGLDVGCGQGRHSLEFLRRGCQVAALDLLPDDLRHTRYLLTAVGREVEIDSGPAPGFVVLKGNALRLPFPTGRFDRVICSEVLEHVTDPESATAELVRVLRPGGLIAISVPTPMTEWAFWFASDDYFNSPGGHVRIFTPGRAAAMLRRHGLQVDDISLEHSFHSIYWWVRSVFGLHDEAHPAIRHFKKVLTYTLFSPMLARAERALNHVIPKSMVLYGRKVGTERTPKAENVRAARAKPVKRTKAPTGADAIAHDKVKADAKAHDKVKADAKARKAPARKRTPARPAATPPKATGRAKGAKSGAAKTGAAKPRTAKTGAAKGRASGSGKGSTITTKRKKT